MTVPLIGGAPKGAMNHEKFKTDAQRQKVFKDLVNHLENAWDLDSFEHLDYEGIQRYCEKYPEIFIPEEIARAKRVGHKKIEKMLVDIGTGKSKGNAGAAVFLAKNKLRYRDRVEVSNDPDAPFKAAGLERDAIMGHIAAIFIAAGVAPPLQLGDGAKAADADLVVVAGSANGSAEFKG